jgi:RimJ/RimL family protein N-acetyltransferase
MILTTSRLLLRPMQARDAPALFAILGDAQATAFWDRPALPRLATVEAQMADELAAMAAGRSLYWTVFEGPDAVGTVDLSNLDSHSASTGFAFRRDHWGQGLGRQAVARVLDHGFETLGLRRAMAQVQTGNRRAIRLLEALGFQKEEALPDIVRDGEARSRVLYALSRSASRNGR